MITTTILPHNTYTIYLFVIYIFVNNLTGEIVFQIREFLLLNWQFNIGFTLLHENNNNNTLRLKIGTQQQHFFTTLKLWALFFCKISLKNKSKQETNFNVHYEFKKTAIYRIFCNCSWWLCMTLFYCNVVIAKSSSVCYTFEIKI
jgi:hypothetical protein